MNAKPKPEPDDKEQSARFVETAKQLKVDESGKVFEEIITSVTAPRGKYIEKTKA